MIKILAAAAAALLLSGVCLAQDTPAKPDAATTGAAAARGMRPSVNLNFEEAYKSAGVSEAQLKQLKEIDQKLRESRGDREKVKQLRDERAKILTPEQMTKVRQSMVEQMQKSGINVPMHATTASAEKKAEEPKAEEKK